MKSQDRDYKSKFDGLSDEELLARLDETEDSRITEYLLNKYKNLVKVKAASMLILGADTDDLIQEGMIGLFKAMRDYDSGRDASFYTFAELCVSRQMYTAVTAARRQKHMPLNSYISLYGNSSEQGGDGNLPPLEETIPVTQDNPESIIIDRENVEEIEHWIGEELSDFERQCIELYLTGMNYIEIARVLNKDEKSTDNALNRAKNKLKKQFGKERK